MSTATITQLSILGIRSFSNRLDDRQTIKFSGPLCLIVGLNGSGKTTIIECLRFATTGHQPPNTAKGAFIHDPTIVNEPSVMAQVKLGFKTASGARLVVTRSLSCTVKKGGDRQMKTLEGALLLSANGERTTLSTRVSELDTHVPRRLGVSQAILDNVIFCHQDESLWPMAIPTELKKKFDLIFDAEKYTKAIDNLRLIKKEQNIELGKLKIYEENLKVTKEKGQKVKKRMEDLGAQIDVGYKQSEELGVRAGEAFTIMAAKKREAQKALGYKNELEQNRSNATFIQKQVDDLRKTIEEFQESDDWLASTLAQYNDRMAAYRDEETRYQADSLQLSRSLQSSRNELSEKQAERGTHMAQKEAYEDKILSRAKLVKEAAARHEIRGYDGDLDDNQIDEFVTKLRKLSKEKDRELARIKKSFDDELQQARTGVAELENKRTILTQGKLNASRTVAENEKQSSRIQRDVDRIKVDEGHKAALKDSLKAVQEKHRRANEEFDAARWDHSVKNEQKGLRELEGEEERLRTELGRLSKLASERAELDHVKNDLKKAQSSLDTMVSTYGDQLSTTIGQGWQTDTLEHEYQDAVDLCSRTVADATKQQDSVVRNLNQVEFQLKTLRSTHKKKTETRKANETAVIKSVLKVDGSPLLSLEDYEDEYLAITEDRDEARKELAGGTHLNAYYDHCLKEIESEARCRTCYRKFADEKEKSAACKRLERLIAKNTQETLEKQLAYANKRYDQASAVRSQADMLKVLIETELPALEKEVDEVERKRSGLVRDVEKLDSKVKDELAAKSVVDGLGKTVARIVEYASQISDRGADIARISSTQSISGSSLSSEEINEQLNTNSSQIKTARAKIDKLSSDKNLAQGAISTLYIDISDATRKLTEAQHELDKKQDLLGQLERYRESTIQHRATIQATDVELEALGPHITKTKGKEAEVKERGLHSERQIQTDKDRLADTVNKFNLVEADITSYIDSQGPQRLAACHRAIKGIEENQARINGDLLKVQNKIEELKKLVSDSQHTKRSIEENIRFRKQLSELESYKQKIDDLEGRNVSGDFDRLAKEAVQAEKFHQNLMAERATIVSKVHAQDAQLADYLEEWKADYESAATQFRESHVKVETTKAAIQDVDKYRVALDKAIMKYHSIKMEEINRIIAELWRETYQGTDVDTIMIRSEGEDDSKLSETRRNYNYRVAMVKGSAEMDMRGRCSAGQKVLACIIIRLALAEVFGVGCGLIALDEPTTNLDSDTIKSLAQSLNKIIQARRGQANFQLIVITHDEHFLKEMKCQEFTDTYYRVSRDSAQKSVITEQDIGNILG